MGGAGRLDAPGTSAPPGLLLVEEMLSLAPVLARQASWLMSRGEFPAEPLEPNYIRAPDALLKRGRRR